MIYLLDLNYTLVGNSPARGEPRLRPFTRQIEQECYRQWLVELLRPHYTILITARPERFKLQTMERIKEQMGWLPQEAYFAEILRPPQFIKEDLLKKYIFPKHGKDGRSYFAIESNPWTRSMYKRYGIHAVKVEKLEEEGASHPFDEGQFMCEK